MLSVNAYTPEYIDACRARVSLQISTYRAVAAAGRAEAGAAFDAFESQFFSTMVLLLDALFVHRSRTMEKKDGNPLNEVRVLCNSLLQNGGTVMADKSIKLDPAKSVLGHRAGDDIRLDEDDFERLAAAFFAEVERKYS